MRGGSCYICLPAIFVHIVIRCRLQRLGLTFGHQVFFFQAQKPTTEQNAPMGMFGAF